MSNGGRSLSADPTRIDLEVNTIELDALVARYSGITAHKHMEFDVPFISEIAENLWMGGVIDGLVLPAQVKHVVSLYPWERYSAREGLLTDLEVRQYDGRQVDADQVIELADLVNERRKSGVVLVHCQAGLNRSGLIVGLALVRSGMTPEGAIALLRAKRSPAVLCNPTFEAFLRAQA
jgi:protein-tyrosine phosphatase